jgi:hypothetical protein
MLLCLQCISIFVGLLVNALMTSSPEDSVTNTAKWFKSFTGITPPPYFNANNTDKIVRFGGLILIILGISPFAWERLIIKPIPQNPPTKPGLTSALPIPKDTSRSQEKNINKVNLTLSINRQLLDGKISKITPLAIDVKTGIGISFINGDQTLRNALFEFEINECKISGGGWYLEPNEDGHVAVFKLRDNIPPELPVGLPMFMLACDNAEPKTGAITVFADDVKSVRYRFTFSEKSK